LASDKRKSNQQTMFYQALFHQNPQSEKVTVILDAFDARLL